MAHTFNLTTSGSRWISESSSWARTTIVITAPNIMILCARDLGGWDGHAMQTELMWVVLLREKEWKRGEGRDQPEDRIGGKERQRDTERGREISKFCLLKGQNTGAGVMQGWLTLQGTPKGRGQMCHDANNNPVSTKKKKPSNNNKKQQQNPVIKMKIVWDSPYSSTAFKLYPTAFLGEGMFHTK